MSISDRFNFFNHFIDEVEDLTIKAKDKLGLRKRNEFYTSPTSSAGSSESLSSKDFFQVVEDKVFDGLLHSPIKAIRQTQVSARLQNWQTLNHQYLSAEGVVDKIMHFFQEETGKWAMFPTKLDLSNIPPQGFPLEIFELDDFQGKNIIIALPKEIAENELPEKLGNLKREITESGVRYIGQSITPIV